MNQLTNVKRMEIEPKPSLKEGVFHAISMILLYVWATWLFIITVGISGMGMWLLMGFVIMFVVAGTVALYNLHKWNEQRQIPNDLRNAFLGDD